MWDLPGPGLEPVSPALAGQFLTTAPPGKSHYFILSYFVSSVVKQGYYECGSQVCYKDFQNDSDTASL